MIPDIPYRRTKEELVDYRLTISFHQSELRKLANKVGHKEAYKTLIEKWNAILKQYFSKKENT